MIDYETLCVHISDWREGKRPGLPPPLPGGVVAAPPEEYGEGYEQQAGYAEQAGYEEQSGDQEAATIEEYEELQPDVALEDDTEAAATHVEAPASGYEELDTTLEEGGAADEFAESPVDRTAAYVPEHYDPAGVAEQMAASPEPAPEEIPMEDMGALMAEEAPEMPDMSVEDMGDVEVDADVDVEDADEFERDYDLEEVDDYASFDPYTDLKAFFKAEAHITAVWEDDEQRRAALAQYGIRDEQHFYQVTSSMERYFISDDAETRYGGLDGIMQLKLDASQETVREEQQARIEGELASDFEPVHGITLQQWAAAQAQIAQGAEAGPVVAQLGLDDATWQAVSAEWNDRMSRDTTATIATEYGKAFAAGGAGQYGEAGQAAAEAMDSGGDPAGDPPISIEQWVEIEVAQSVGYEQGRDAAEVLASFGMTPADWGMASAWWSQYFARHAMENGGALHQHYSQLREHYEAHYRGA
ncbi:MAG: hypothetical protein ACE37F_14665 [Nannocystaceae bacterium]|nr:hypothetical protein [bacterium]